LFCLLAISTSLRRRDPVIVSVLLDIMLAKNGKVADV